MPGKYMCEQCSNALQVPLFHVPPTDCPRIIMPMNLKKQRTVVVTPDPSRLEGSQMATKNRPRQPKAGPGQSMRNASSKAVGEFLCKKRAMHNAVQTATWPRLTRTSACCLIIIQYPNHSKALDASRYALIFLCALQSVRVIKLSTHIIESTVILNENF